jgi:hypothetical protein
MHRSLITSGLMSLAMSRIAFPSPPPSPNKVSTLKWRFHSSILSLWFPLSTLNSTTYDAKPMNRGLGGVLTLPSRGLVSGAATSDLLPIYLGALGVMTNLSPKATFNDSFSLIYLK